MPESVVAPRHGRDDADLARNRLDEVRARVGSDLEFASIRRAIIDDADNSEMTADGFLPLYVAGPSARIAVVGQAPGRRAQESNLAWNDASGAKLMQWLGVTESQFRDPGSFALLPMDFYYPGKATTGDLPPRKTFAARWHPPLLQIMPNIKLTVLVGRYAQEYYLGERARGNVTETVRAFRNYVPRMIPVVHPSPLNFRWQARNPWFESELLPVLRELVAAVLE